MRRGVVALSSLYVERRDEGALAERAVRGSGKRAAFAAYYAPLHVLALHHGLRALPAGWLEPAPRRVFDLGCGTGAAAAALATVLDDAPRVHAVDRSGWALAEARHTLRAFGLPHTTRRASLPGGFPRTRPGDLVLLAFVVNECGEREAELRSQVARALAGGARVLLAEPLAGAAAPWWDDWARELAPLGAATRVVRARVRLPEALAKMDRAAGLDHCELAARLLYGPASGTEPLRSGR